MAGDREQIMTMVTDNIQTLESRHVLQTYRRQPVTFVRGKGVRLYDSEGREYIDLLSGIGVAALGHAHEGLARAITDQAQTLLHTSNLFFHPLQGQLAARLTSLSGLERAFFCNSGTEAIEASLKFARRYWHTLGESRTEIVALEESFHGRTIGSLSVTSDEHYRAPFEPLLSGVKWIDANKPAAVLAAVTDKPPRSSSSRSRAKVASVRSRRRLPPPSTRRARAPAPCSSPTKCSRAADGPAIRSTRRPSASSRT